MFPLTGGLLIRAKIVIQHIMRALHFDVRLSVCVNYEINLLRTSIRCIDTYATAEEAECPINRQSHNRYIELPCLAVRGRRPKQMMSLHSP
jgi:hypothetical protein